MKKFQQLYTAIRQRISRSFENASSTSTNQSSEPPIQFCSPLKLWHQNIEDSEYVSKSINAYLSPYEDIYKFLRMANFDVFSNIQIRTADGTCKPTSSCLEYVLRHANRARLLVNSRRITDLRDEVRASSSSGTVQFMDLTVFYHPAGMITYLQYGGKLFPDNFDDPESLKPLAAIFVVFRTNYEFFKSREPEDDDNGADDEDEFSAFEPRWNRDRWTHSIKAVEAILMTIHKPQLATYLIAGTRLEDPRYVRRHPEVRYALALPEVDQLVPFYDQHFPGWDLGRLVPATLKHVCRCFIREKLNDCWLLPDGIAELGLPPILQDYLNLNN